MKYFADECCDAGLVAALRESGYDITYALESKSGVTDDEILASAYAEKRILLTEDKDFGELVYRLNKPARGIILLRIPVEMRDQKINRLLTVLERFEDRLQGNFVVIELDKIRIRTLQR